MTSGGTVLVAVALLASGFLVSSGEPARAAAYMGRKEALEAAFPGAIQVERRRFFLSPEQRAAVRELSGVALDDGFVTVYVGREAVTEPGATPGAEARSTARSSTSRNASEGAGETPGGSASPREGDITGYAYFETHNVRTVPETLLVVLDPAGKVASVLMLAFYEPPEFEPSRRWLDQFRGRELNPDLRIRRGVHGIAGASLSASAVTRGVRRVLALHRVLLEKDSAEAGPEKED